MTEDPAPPTTPSGDDAGFRRLPAPLGFLAGALMGCADSVPGVSGGTIALIVGVYERLIESISRVLKAPALLRHAEGRRRLAEAVRFLAPLLFGLALAMFFVTKLLAGPRDAPGLLCQKATAPFFFAFFFGLVVASLREPWGRISHRRTWHMLLALAGAALAAWFAGLATSTTEPPPWALLYGGALAVSVMLLPGVSGGLLLLVLGQWATVNGAIHSREYGLVAIFGAGMLIGVSLFVPLLRRALRRHHDPTMAILTGLMAGSLRALWPWKTHYDPRNLEAGPVTNIGPFGPVIFVVLAAVLGIVAAWGLARLERKMNPSNRT